ncbi:phospholipase D-like domain-containing protein [Acidihalobacter prosperus]|uniref:PLD phosphodiesterase domain-containing protein n=1 Tax=Acidihalobacter prosperus TaxID=160660 RepID=A0A1A6C251_9GAMM|nr:phospholipase D-like domain-containing protein [Acidihalobacter prosperus]OBS08633.1 hypothetical protein Thpro_022883 [Acidihalobacter prosperus]
MIRPPFTRHARATRFPQRAGHRLELLVDGHRFFPAMLDAIAGARCYVLMEMYLFESGALAARFIEALRDAARRGASVRLLIDDFGALGLHARDRERLRAGGVTLAFYNPLRVGRLSANLHRDHRKLLLIDGRVAFTGGSGITDDFDPGLRPHGWWHDLMLRMEGPAVSDWQHLFQQIWQRSTADAPALPAALPDATGPHAVRVVANDGRRREIQRRLVRRIAQARQRVSISVAYFVPPLRIRAALRRAARRGVEVRLIVPGRHTDHQAARYAGRRFYAQLLRAGVRIHEYTPRFTHVKLMICDDWVSLGSANLDHWTLRWNLEANAEIDGAAFAATAQAAFEADLADTREITLETWRARGRRARAREWFWGLISRWLARHGRRARPRPAPGKRD